VANQLYEFTMKISDQPLERVCRQVWPEFASDLPSQEQLPSLVEKGAVFFGPFGGFK